MPVFESDAEAHERLGSLLRAIAADSDLGPKAREADAVVQLSLRAPEATVTADLRAGRGVRVETGSPKLSPDVILAMDGDVAHQLWSGELNPLLALAHGQVRTKGSTAKVLRLVPLFVAAAPRYREWVEGGFPEVAEEAEAAAPEAESAEAAPAEAAPAEAAPEGEAPAPEEPAPAADEAPAPERAATEEEAAPAPEAAADAEAAPPAEPAAAEEAPAPEEPASGADEAPPSAEPTPAAEPEAPVAPPAGEKSAE